MNDDQLTFAPPLSTPLSVTTDRIVQACPQETAMLVWGFEYQAKRQFNKSLVDLAAFYSFIRPLVDLASKLERQRDNLRKQIKTQPKEKA